MKMIAEGVEMTLQLVLLQSTECEFAQRNFFLSPIKLQDLYDFKVS